MSKPANARRGEVALPEVGEGVFLRFSVDSLERLLSKHGEGYVNVITLGLAGYNPAIFRDVLEVTLNGAEAKDFPWEYSFEELHFKILDAFCLTLYRRTFAEQQKVDEARSEKEWEDAKTNPQKAAALLSQLFSSMGVRPDSFLKTSDDTPSSTSPNSPDSIAKTNGIEPSTQPG